MVYLVDILINSPTIEDHLAHLGEVLSRIQSAGLKLNHRTCHVAWDHVVFLGHVVSRQGLQPDPRNTEKVRNWPTPCNPSEVTASAVLAQQVEGPERVVAYASQALTHPQKRWSTFDRVLWAIVWALREFKHNVGLSAFTIISDHRPLLGLRKKWPLTTILQDEGAGGFWSSAHSTVPLSKKMVHATQLRMPCLTGLERKGMVIEKMC